MLRFGVNLFAAILEDSFHVTRICLTLLRLSHYFSDKEHKGWVLVQKPSCGQIPTRQFPDDRESSVHRWSSIWRCDTPRSAPALPTHTRKPSVQLSFFDCKPEQRFAQQPGTRHARIRLYQLRSPSDEARSMMLLYRL